MQQAVQSGRSHDDITGKDLAPVREGLVAGEDDGLLFLVALADGLKQKAGVRGFEREIADLIDDEQFRPGKIFNLAGETIFRHGFGHAACEIDGRGEVDAMAHLGGENAQGDGEMRFADAGRYQNIMPIVRRKSRFTTSGIRCMGRIYVCEDVCSCRLGTTYLENFQMEPLAVFQHG